MSLLSIALAIAISPGSGPYIWRGYGGNASHDAVSTVRSAPLSRVHWQASLDDRPSYYDGALYIHYASPCITARNTLVHSFRFTTEKNGAPDYDNWRAIGRDGSTGRQLWFLNTDYSAPIVFDGNENDWTSVYPLGLWGSNAVAAAGAGGTVLEKADADVPMSPVERVVFYTSLPSYRSNPWAYQSIKICTPFTSDSKGNLWFGYVVESAIPGVLGQRLGGGGMVRISSSGRATWRSVGSLGVDAELLRPALQAAPALSRDGRSVYYVVRDSGGFDSQIVKLNAEDLSLEAHVQMQDPSISGGAVAIDQESSSPMVGPDGHVFFGVFGNQWRESHGWMLQFDENLNPNDENGDQWPFGAFGWDDTASVVPRSMVPGYTGRANYLILTKYNDYALNPDTTAANGVGVNKVAILDPTSNSESVDWQSGLFVMNEILLIVGPTPDYGARGSGYANAVNEWCINSAVIDPFSDCAIINSEDGHCYKWSLVTNTLGQGVRLAQPTGEAYTSTVIGPDGTCYAINDAVLYAVGR